MAVSTRSQTTVRVTSPTGRIITDEAFLYVPWTPTDTQDRTLSTAVEIASVDLLAALQQAQNRLSALSASHPDDPRLRHPLVSFPFSKTPWCRAALRDLLTLLEVRR